ncbi:hypothetical protein WME97_40120 [Sorangium sp. So ce367]|uniref:hypothetical protein n=1 Tax=Sorangium sp. So ce367 TaxID=3133305 RepID=UPI003F61FAC8
MDLAELADDAEELGGAFAENQEAPSIADDAKLTTLVLAAERSELQDLQAQRVLISAVTFLRGWLDRALHDGPVAASKSVYKSPLYDLTSALRREASTSVVHRTEREQRFAMMTRFYRLAHQRPKMAFHQSELCHDFGNDQDVTDRWVQWALSKRLLMVADQANGGDRLLKITTAGIDWVESTLESWGAESDQQGRFQLVLRSGEIHMGNKYTITNTNSTVGAQGVGDNITVTGSLTIGAPGGTVSQTQFDEHIKAAKKALVDDEDRLDDLVREALTQFLTLARKIQVEQQSLAEVQAKMKETLDEVWAQQASKGLRPQTLPEGLKVIETLAKSPITAEVAKKLLLGA